MRKKLILLFAAGIVIPVMYLLFFYSPYSDERLQNAWIEVQHCDDDALLYLADYYEKRNDLTEYKNVMQAGARCGKPWAKDLLDYMAKQKR